MALVGEGKDGRACNKQHQVNSSPGAELGLATVLIGFQQSLHNMGQSSFGGGGRASGILFYFKSVASIEVTLLPLNNSLTHLTFLLTNVKHSLCHDHETLNLSLTH